MGTPQSQRRRSTSRTSAIYGSRRRSAFLRMGNTSRSHSSGMVDFTMRLPDVSAVNSSKLHTSCRFKSGRFERRRRRLSRSPRSKAQLKRGFTSSGNAKQSRQRNQAGASKKIRAFRKGVRPDHEMGSQQHPTDKKERERPNRSEVLLLLTGNVLAA